MNGKEDGGAATGPARTRVDRVLILDRLLSEVSRRRNVLPVVRTTGSDDPAVDPNRSTREDTPSTARIAAGMNAATIIGAITETAHPVMALIIPATAVAAVATEVACAVVEALVATAVTTVVTVANVATWARRISTVIRWVAPSIITITTRL